LSNDIVWISIDNRIKAMRREEDIHQNKTTLSTAPSQYLASTLCWWLSWSLSFNAALQQWCVHHYSIDHRSRTYRVSMNWADSLCNCVRPALVPFNRRYRISTSR
jgi:hypothetical protein